MATTADPKTKLDVPSVQQKLTSQFRGLNPNDPSSWPLLPQALLYLFLMAAIVVGLWFAWLSGSNDELEAEHKKELVLRDEYKKKLGQAVNLEGGILGLETQRLQNSPPLG